MSIVLPAQGDVLDGKYRIDRVIGEGGMGIVYEAFHLRLRQRVAIKVLRPDICAHPEFVARFEREARAAATLDSPHVAKVLDVDTSADGLTYMVIEFLEGNDLAEELTRRGRFPIQEAVAYLMEACVPIAQAHAVGIIHRDLKPSNLFLAKKGSERILKLLDFGISKVLTDADAKSTSSLALGTPHYMSPEHVRNASDVDRRSDIWSLGVILYELLTGTEPFQGEPAQIIAAIVTEPVPSPRASRSDVPPELEAVIIRAMQKNPRDRFPDVRAFARALVPFAPEVELVAAPSSSKFPAARSFHPPTPLVSPSRTPPPVVADPRDVPTMVLPKRSNRLAVVSAAAIAVAIGGLSWWGLRASASHHEVARTSEPPPAVVEELHAPTAIEPLALTAAPPPRAEDTNAVPTPRASASSSAPPRETHVSAPAPKPSAAPAATAKPAENPFTL
ncbi:MAG TPA: protein kinase [Polyangiaceae bacterium]|jgi:serine/threonine-protein kinase